MALAPFPEEILLKIFQGFRGSEATLFNICLVSRTFHRIVMSLLYDTIALVTHEQKVALAATLTNNRHLQSLVHSVGMSLDCCHIFHRSTADSATCTVPTMGLLDLMPKLYEARFWNFRSRPLLQIFDGPRQRIPAGLRSLTSLTLDWEDTGEGFGAKDIALCMSLPSLKMLNVDSVSNDIWIDWDKNEETIWELDSRSGTSALTELTIRTWASLQDFSILEGILGVPTGLVALSIHFDIMRDDALDWGPDERLDSDPDACPSRIVDGLLTSHATLKCLRVLSDGNPWGNFMSLTAFTDLTTLQCELTTLLLSTQGQSTIIPLPGSLHTLAIAWNSDSHQDLHAFIRMLATGRPPALRHLSVHFARLRQGTKETVRERLHEVCGHAGVEFAGSEELWSAEWSWWYCGD